MDYSERMGIKSERPDMRPAIDAKAISARLDDESESLRNVLSARKHESRKLFKDDCSGNPILRQSFVTYLDELGTTARLQNYSDSMLREDIALYDQARKLLHDEQMKDSDYQRVLYFSDNLVVVEPIDDEAIPDEVMFAQLVAVAVYQLNLAARGRFLRGGFAKGWAYADGQFVTGPAHVCAVLLEEQQAVVPRILLNADAVDLARKNISVSTPDSEFSTLLLVDCDGSVFVNYLPLVFEDASLRVGPDPLDGLIHHRDQIQRMRQQSTSARIAEKYNWVASYHNYVVSQSPYSGCSQLLIDNAPGGNFKPLT